MSKVLPQAFVAVWVSQLDCLVAVSCLITQQTLEGYRVTKQACITYGGHNETLEASSSSSLLRYIQSLMRFNSRDHRGVLRGADVFVELLFEFIRRSGILDSR